MGVDRLRCLDHSNHLLSDLKRIIIHKMLLRGKGTRLLVYAGGVSRVCRLLYERRKDRRAALLARTIARNAPHRFRLRHPSRVTH
jgi:hypothetical protein